MDDEDGLLTEQLQVQKASRIVFTATVVYQTIPRVPKPSGRGVSLTRRVAG